MPSLPIKASKKPASSPFFFHRQRKREIKNINTIIIFSSPSNSISSGLPADSPSQLEAISDVRALAVLLLVKLNDRLTMFFGPEYQFGQWYFQRLIGVESVESARAVLVDIWRTGVLPQLEEYFVGRSDQLLGVLGLSTISPALSISEPSSMRVLSTERTECLPVTSILIQSN